MDKRDEIIYGCLQQEMSDEEVMPDEDCSDVEPHSVEYAAQVEDCESESEIEGDDDEISVQDNLSQPEPTGTVSPRPRSSSRVIFIFGVCEKNMLQLPREIVNLWWLQFC